MARPAGLTESNIQQAIRLLEAEGQDLTVTRLRERLGSGSFGTLNEALKAWRQEKNQRPPIPEAPSTVALLFQQLWEEAFRLAEGRAEAERKQQAEERAAW